jgi:hypothetical protein
MRRRYEPHMMMNLTLISGGPFIFSLAVGHEQCFDGRDDQRLEMTRRNVQANAEHFPQESR